MPEHNVYRDGKVHVQAEKCSTCIFHPGNRMGLHRGRVRAMVEATQEPGATIPCHQTLEEYEGPQSGHNAVCRGWWDAYAKHDPILMLGERMGVIELQHGS